MLKEHILTPAPQGFLVISSVRPTPIHCMIKHYFPFFAIVLVPKTIATFIYGGGARQIVCMHLELATIFDGRRFGL